MPDQLCSTQMAFWAKNRVAILTLWRPAGVGDFREKTTGSHVVLHARNSSAESSRELFKGSKDTESLLVCT